MYKPAIVREAFKIRFGLTLSSKNSLKEQVRHAVLAENSGLKFAWVWDHFGPLNRDVWSVLAAVATATNRIEFGPGVYNIFTRHPAFVAVTMSTIDEASKGRAILGVGIGPKEIPQLVGMENATDDRCKRPLTALRESVEICKRLFTGELLTYKGEVFSVEKVRLDPLPMRHIPIFIGSKWPKSFELAAEVADGVLTTAPASYFQLVLGLIRDGLKKTSKEGKFRIINRLPLCVGEDEEKARDSVKETVASSVAWAPRYMLKGTSIDEADVVALREAMRIRNRDFSEFVTDSMIDEFSIAGTPSRCIEKIGVFAKAGVTDVSFSSPFGERVEDAFQFIRTLSQSSLADT